MQQLVTINYSIVPDHMAKEFEQRALNYYIYNLKQNGAGWIGTDMELFDMMLKEVEDIASFHVFGDTSRHRTRLHVVDAEEFSEYIRQNEYYFMGDMVKALDHNRVFFKFELTGELANAPVTGVW